MTDRILKTYQAGGKVNAEFRFAGGDDTPNTVSAIFTHEEKADRLVRLSGADPVTTGSASGGSDWQIKLCGSIPLSAAPGVYRCAALWTEYSDGRRADFDRMPNDDRFRVERQPVSRPSVKSWDWRY
jgi:hypothetical protein